VSAQDDLIGFDGVTMENQLLFPTCHLGINIAYSNWLVNFMETMYIIYSIRFPDPWNMSQDIPYIRKKIKDATLWWTNIAMENGYL
jgi:hypothetical protein